MVANFESILDFGFTAQVEQRFDAIAEGDKIIADDSGLYDNFNKTVNHVKERAARIRERVLGMHPENDRPIKVVGKYAPIAQIGNP